MQIIYRSLALITATFLGCGSPEEVPGLQIPNPGSDITADMAYGDSDDGCPRTVQFDWLEKRDGKWMTTARIQGLNGYAEEKLASRQCEVDETLRFRGVDPEEVAPISVYRVEVGNEQHCMEGGWLLVSFDLESDERYQAMKTQVDNTIEFLKRFHEDTNGMGTVMFDTVIICPKGWWYWGQEFVLSGPNLNINLPATGWESFWTFNARELRDDRWTPGKHFNLWADKKMLKRIWPLFDPAGTVRHALRSGIADRVRRLLSGLLDIAWNINGQPGDLESIRTTLIGLVRDNVSDSTTAIDHLIRSDRERLRCIADVWSEYLADPTRISAASEAATAVAYKASARNRMNVTVKQNGTIVIGNTHFININLDVFLSSGYQDLEEYIEVREVEQNITWDQSGFFVIYTVDDININVNVSANRAVQTAGLEEALQVCR